MIPNHIVQAALIAKWKASSTITNALNSSADIKESQWQGTDFLYPAIRLNIGSQTNDRRSPFCNFGYLPFSVRVFSEMKSSMEADMLAGLVNSVTHGSYAVGTGMILNNIECLSLIGAIRIGEQLWQSQIDYISLLTKH